jgi:hypothetical protein
VDLSYRRVEEVGVAETFVHQVHVGPEREGRVGVAEPRRHLLEVPAGVEQQRRAGVSEGVEAHPRGGLPVLARGHESDRLGGGVQHPAGDVRAAELGPRRRSERRRARSRSAIPAQSGMFRRACPDFKR